MSLEIVALIVIGLFLVMLFSGIKIGITLAAVSIIGIALTTNFNIAINMLGTTTFNAIKDYVFAVIPLFVLMGLFASIADMGADLYNAAHALLKKVRGGMAMATVVANAIFAALTGSSIASAAVFSKISLPEMMRFGYDKKVASGTIAGTSVLGMLIPPSALMIIYGTITGESIGKMFIAGILPGLLLSALFIVQIVVLSGSKPKKYGVGFAPEKNTADGVEVDSSWKTILKPWPALLLILLVIGGIWGGLFTPTEAGGIGAIGALLLVIFKKKFTWAKLWSAFSDAGKTTGSILFLFIAAQMFSRMLAMTGIISSLTQGVMSLGLAPVVIVSLFCVLQLLMGCILDSTSILLLTIPLFMPVISQIGYDPIWYGVVSIITIEMGLITPPFGISVFTVKSALTKSDVCGQITTTEIFSGSFPYLISMVLCIILLVVFPEIVTFLPKLML